jgi:hypothetical protein
MNQKDGKQRQTLGLPRPSPVPKSDPDKLKQTAEQNEVAGRHKNDGQIGHKGAR